MTSGSEDAPRLGSPEWAKSIGRGEAWFNFDDGALPDGLVAGRSVLSQFLDPPDERADWFSNKAWQQTAEQLLGDPAITDEEFTDLKVYFNRAQDALMRWTKARPDMSKGYAETLSDEQRATMSYALRFVRALANQPGGRLALLRGRDGLRDDSKAGLDNFTQVLWEYFECMAFELEASHDGIPVTAVRNRFETGDVNAWEPAVTPDNIDTSGITLGGHRTPVPETSAPDPSGSGDPASGDPGTVDPGVYDPGAFDPPTGEGGEGEE